MKSLPEKINPPSILAAHRFVCGCFGITEKDLTLVLERIRKTAPDADKHFPRKLSRVMLMRAENGNGRWQDALFTLHREALYERIRRDAGAILLLAATKNVQAQYNYNTLPFEAYGISGNNVVGYYYSGGSANGFLYNDSGYTTLSVPGVIDTYAYGISGNNIVGYYNDGSNYYGFLYNGTSYTTLNVPGATGTFIYGIDGNKIVGVYNAQAGAQAFLYSGTSYTTLSVPGAVYTQANGISGNNIVGTYNSQGGMAFCIMAAAIPRWPCREQMTLMRMVSPATTSWEVTGTEAATRAFWPLLFLNRRVWGCWP